MKYPFNEGDDYWTIEPVNNAEYKPLVSNEENPSRFEVVWSCWDDVSEDMHDENPNQVYFTSEEQAYGAVEFINDIFK